MSTDFFQRQSDARRSTKWLVGMFILAVILIVGSVTLASALAIDVWNENPNLHRAAGIDSQARVNKWQVPAFAGVGTLALILLGSLYKVAQLRGGGTTVAENVGGRRIAPNTTDPVERRLTNVVEEMALASGVPVPPVYLLPEEQGINAFAAGYSPSDAVVAVTRGTAEQLTRDQLQGVIAHEFSHILNGDMRLNIRLIGILHGILLLTLLGRFLLRSGYYTDSRDSKGGTAYLVAMGLLLLVLGFIGSLFGSLIKAALSRQREYLADASAVQFTRNPGGIAGALKRIGAAIAGSRIKHRNAAEASHMYFSQGVWEGFTGLMATHPPLEKRIYALEPNWNGKFPATSTRTPATTSKITGAAAFTGASASADHVPLEVVENAADQVGNPDEIHRRYAHELIGTLPENILNAVREPYGARAVIFALLLDEDESVRQIQLQALANTTTPDIVAFTEALAPSVRQLDARARLPLVDMSLAALRAMTRSQYIEFTQAFKKLVEADERIGLFEWTLHRVLLRHLQPQFEEAAAPPIAYYGLQRLGRPCSILLSTLAYAGNSETEARRAFAEAAEHLPKAKLELLPPAACGLQQLDQALTELVKVAAKHRERLIDACAAAVCADNTVKIREAELLRGISDMLNCPMPPLLPGQQVS